MNLTIGNSGGFNRELKDLLSNGSYFIGWGWRVRQIEHFTNLLDGLPKVMQAFIGQIGLGPRSSSF